MATLREVIEADATLSALAAAGDYPGVAAWLNEAPAAANPVAQGMTPKHITLKRVMEIVPASEMVAVYGLPGFVADVKTAIDAGDREYMTTLITIAVTAGAVSQATAGLLAAELAATELDPDWTPTVPGPARWQTAGLAGPVTASDVQGAVHATT